MSNIIGINHQNKNIITVGSKCYNCIYLKALKITGNILSDERVICSN